MHPLLRIALLFCPRSFRQECEAQIRLDAGNQRWRGAGTAIFLCANIAGNGLALHFEMWWRNLALAVRSLSHERAYAAVSIVTIALAIGANIAVASAIQGVLLNPLPYPEAHNLYYVSKDGAYGGWSYLNAHDYLSKSTTLSDLGLAAPDAQTLQDRGAPVRLEGKEVDGGYFRVFGVRAELGRLISAGDMGRPVVVISDALWRSRFARDPAVIGRSVRFGQTFGGQAVYRIIGIAPPGFRDPRPGGLDRSDYWIPDDRFALAVRVRGDSEAFARLRRGVSVAAARADLQRVVAQLDRQYPNPALVRAPSGLTPLLTAVVGDVRPLLWLLYGAVDVLLIIALANITNLALVRAAARGRELVVRGALGAGRREIAGQLSAESGLIALAGGAIGIALGYAGLRLCAPFGEQMMPRWEGISVGPVSAAYTVALVVVATIVSGLLPVLWLQRDVAGGLRSAGRSGDRSGSRPLRTLLIVTEVALAICVVVSAGLIVRSFIALTHVDIGFDAENLVYISHVTPRNGRMNTFPGRVRTTQDLLAHLRAIPGVVGAAAAESVPFGRCCIVVAANVPANSSQQYKVVFSPVSPPYFNLMKIPLLRGREFTAADRLDTQPVALVNRTFATQYFGSMSRAMGKRIFAQFDIDPPGKPVTNVPRTIVGVVGDTRETHSRAPRPEVYVTTSQFPHFPDYVLRTSRPDAGLANAVTAAMRAVDPSAPAPTIAPFSALLANDALTQHVETLLFAVFAFLALALALAGVYAVTAYSVEQQTREFGIRRALGARDAQVAAGVLRAAARYAAAGIGVGIVLAAFAGKFLNVLLFQTSALDPITYAAAIVFVTACAVVAALVPAVRAVRVNPVEALHYE